MPKPRGIIANGKIVPAGRASAALTFDYRAGCSAASAKMVSLAASVCFSLAATQGSIVGARRQLIRYVRRYSLIGALVTAPMVAIVSAAMAQTGTFILPDFSATEIAHVKGRQIAYKIYHSGLNFRVEPAPGLARLYMPARDTFYELMFNGTQCIETKGMRVQPISSPLQLLSGAKVKRTADGTEIVDGHTCKIESIKVTSADGTVYPFKVWEATDLKGIPVRIDLQSGPGVVTTTYRDIKPQTPDPALFKPPANCKPFEKTYQIAPPEKHGS